MILQRFTASRFLILSALLFITGLTLPLIAQDAATTNPDSALAIRLKQIQGTALSLPSAIQSAMDKSTEMQQSKARLMSAKAILRRELGMFDPELFASLNYFNNQVPTASFFSGANVLETEQTTGQAGIRMDLPYGTHLEAALNTIKKKTNSSFASLSPEYDTDFSLSVRQPLLNGFAATARKTLSSAEKTLDAAQKRYDQSVLDISTEVEKNYWDLYASERDYAVQQLVRDQAQALLKEAQIRAKAGLVGPNQVANAQVFLAQQELALYDQEERLDQLSDQFASLIGRRPENGMKRFIMSDQPPQDFSFGPVDDMVAQSIKNNFQIQAAKKDVESAKVLADAAGWDVLPKVDLIGTIGGNGLAGTGQSISFNGQTFPAPASSNLSDALSQSFKRDYPSWSIGIEISYPIGSRTDSGNRDQARAQVIIAEQQYIAAERQLEEQIRSYHRELENGIQRLQIARNQVKAAQEQVRIGLIEYRNGRSTAFELVRLAADFAQSQQRYSQELVRAAKAAATLKQLTSGGYPALKTN